nr:hypothetical protein [Tanacetum cinerariifolium]
SFDLQQIAAALEDKLDIRMNRFEKSLNEMKILSSLLLHLLKQSRKFVLPADQIIAIINVHSPEEGMIIRSGMSYKKPPIPPTGVNQQEPVEATKDTEPQNSDDIHPLTVCGDTKS